MGWSSYKYMDMKISLTNASLHSLHKLIVWWEGLSVIEKRNPSNKEHLVEAAEEVSV